MTPDGPGTRNVLSKHQRFTPESEIWSILLKNELSFSRYNVPENQKCTEWPQTELETLTVKNTLYTVYVDTYHRRSNFGQFCSTSSCFWDAKSSKFRNALNDPRLNFEHLTVKSNLYTLNTYPWDPNFGPFRSTINHFRDTICTRSPQIGNAPNDPKLNLNI